MIGLKYIREKSNFTKYALAERMGVTRQTVTLWEKGVRKPDKNHLRWLCDFYGIEEKWFGDLSDDDMEILKKKWMYRHYDGDKEYYSFIPEKDGFSEISVQCEELVNMLDEKYADVLKKKKDFMQLIEDYLKCDYKGNVSLNDKIITANRGMKDIERYLDLMETVQGVGTEGLSLKMPFRFEIMTVLYAMMVASGQYTIEEIRALYPYDFENEYRKIDENYMTELIDVMSKHWTDVKNQELESVKDLKRNKTKRDVV